MVEVVEAGWTDCTVEAAAAAVVAAAGCHGEGMELPTSLPASDAGRRKKRIVFVISSLRRCEA